MISAKAVTAATLDLRIATLKERVSIFEVFKALGGEVIENRTQQVRCPVHPDAKPSARLYTEDTENRLHCFTCGRGWDQVELVQAVRRLPKEGAVQWLEQQFGIALDQLHLADRIRHTLQRTPVVDLRVLITHLEATLIARRDILGLVPYTKALLALDVIAYRHGAGVLSVTEAKAQLEQVQTYALTVTRAAS